MKAPAAVVTQPRNNDNSTRIQFFNVGLLNGFAQTVKILAVEFVKSSYGDVTFTLEMNGRKYIWDRKLNSKAYAVVIGAFGDETDNWTGKELLATPVHNAKFNQAEVEISVPKAKGKK